MRRSGKGVHRTPLLRTGGEPKVLLVLRENSNAVDLMLSREVGVIIAELKASGFAVVVASASGRPIGRGAARVEPDLNLAEVKVADYVGVLLPSMAVGLTAAVSVELIRIVRRAAALKIPLAAQHSSVVVLQRAGVLKKKRYAFQRRVFTVGEYAGPGVVRDGNIITSGTCPYLARETGRPDGTGTLTRLFIEAIMEKKPIL
jgi:putative intracellular protease/amidase